MKSDEKITLSYGSGGKLTSSLINNIILKYFTDKELKKLDDSASLKVSSNKLFFTTDSYTVSPIIFPGGDIGTLAVNGTVNDLAVCGAKPEALSVGIIIEEGLELDTFENIIKSISSAASQAGVRIITGDTKVVQQGKGDKIFINTAGIGTSIKNANLSKKRIKKGDVIIINGGIGEHGTVIMGLQKGMNFKFKLKSDCAPLNRMIEDILRSGNDIKFMRDPTRGGVATTLNEIIEGTSLSAFIYENRLPIKKEVQGICDILGLDPLYLANEGKVLLVADNNDSDNIIKIMKKYKEGKDATVIGEIKDIDDEKVILETKLGTKRIIDVLSGMPLPRIC